MEVRMIISHYFKNKDQIRDKAYKEGYERARMVTESLWKNRLHETRINAKRHLDEKDRIIQSRDKRMKDIEKSLNDFMDTVSSSRFLALDIEKQKNIKLRQIAEEKTGFFRQLAEEQQAIQKRLDDIGTVFRNAEYHSGRIAQKIDKYKTEAM